MIRSCSFDTIILNFIVIFNYSFYITYSKKKLKDTYQKDYLEGSSIISHITNEIEKDILKKTKEEAIVSIKEKLNDFPKQVQEKILQADTYSDLNLYNVEKEYIVNKWSSTEITSLILKFTNSLKENNITPKSYSFIITDANDLTKTISISNLKDDLLTEATLEKIVSDCLNNNNSELLESNEVSFKYLN